VANICVDVHERVPHANEFVSVVAKVVETVAVITGLCVVELTVTRGAVVTVCAVVLEVVWVMVVWVEVLVKEIVVVVA